MLLPCLQLLACGQDLDRSALLQTGLQVQDSDDIAPTAKKFLVDNSHLHHKGPGLLWRSGKELSSTLSKDQYVAWGTMVDGFDAGDGWVRVGNRFLPKEIRGVAVITQQEEGDEHKKLQFRFKPTSILAGDGTWIPCTINGFGSKPDTFDVTVMPPSFASYSMTDVPSGSLKSIKKLREFVTVKGKRPVPRTRSPAAPMKSPAAHMKSTAAQQTRAAADDTDMSGVIEMKVDDFKGNVMELKLLKKSPLRTMMKMACERADIAWFECQSSVHFILNGVQLSETDHSYELGMQDGETIFMQKA